MKRAASDLPNTRIYNPPTALSLLQPQTGTGTAAAREKTPDGSFISLAEPIFGDGSRSLETVLLERLAVLKATRPNDGATAHWHTAVQQILALDQTDATPDIDATMCQFTATVLFEHGQAKLLRRLAQLNVGFTFKFDVGPSEKAAGVLARIGASWPTKAAVSLVLDALLPAPCMPALESFMRSPARLSLRLKANAPADPWATAQFAELVKKREYVELNIDIHERSSTVLVALKGVRTESVCIAAARDNPPLEHMTVWLSSSDLPHAEIEDQFAQSEAAAVELVQGSGATVLRVHRWLDPNITGCVKDELNLVINGRLSARLLATRTHWDCVELNAVVDTPVRRWFMQGQQTIGRLELTEWIDGGSHVAEHLEWAQKNRVHTIVIRSTVHLKGLAKGLEWHLLRSSYVFERIEACFMADWDEEDSFDGYLTMLSRNPVVVNVTHTSELARGQSWFDQDQRDWDFVLLGDAGKTQLEVMSASNRFRPHDERIRAMESTRQTLWAQVINTLSRMLYTGAMVKPLIAYLSDLDHTLSLPEMRELDMSVYSENSTKLKILHKSNLHPGVVKAAIAQAVRLQPRLGPWMCEALLLSGYPLAPLTPPQWKDPAMPFGKTWLREGMTLDNFHVLASPMQPAPTEQPPEPSDVAGAGPVVVPAARALAAHVEPELLVRPSGADSLKQIKARFRHLRDLGDASEDPHLPSAVYGVILDLLEYGTFDPARESIQAVSAQLARVLLDEGQAPLLRHIIGQTAVSKQWLLKVETATAAASLRDLTPWPQGAARQCTVHVRPGLTEGAAVVAFAKRMPPNTMSLQFDMAPYAAPDMLKEIIEDRSDLVLCMSGYGMTAFEPTMAMLQKIRPKSLNVVYLIDMVSTDETHARAMADLLQQWNSPNVRIVGCSNALTTAVAQRRDWNHLRLEFGDGLAEVFKGGRVSAEGLTIETPATVGHAAKVEELVAHCKGLQSLVCEEGAVDVLSLMRGLDRNRSVRSVKAGLAATSVQDEFAAIGILQRNTWITDFEVRTSDVQFGLPACSVWFTNELDQVIARNRWRNPQQASRELSKAFGWSMGAELRDAFGHMGPWLDPDDFLALSQTSKAAYIGSRRPWEIQVDRLAELFLLQDADRFKIELVRQAKEVDPTFVTRHGETPLALWTVNTVSEKAWAMHKLRVPPIAIDQALERAVSKHSTFMAERWLIEVAGINMHAEGLQ